MSDITAKKSTLLTLILLASVFIVLTGCQTTAIVADDEPSTTTNDELQTGPTPVPVLASAPEDIMGTWSVDVGRKLTFYEDGTYLAKRAGGEYPGVYSFSGTELSITYTTDDICSTDVTGTYEVQLLDNALVFVAINDECTMRTLAIQYSGQRWERIP